MKGSPLEKVFTAIANRVSAAAGRPVTFILAVSVIAIWGITGPIFGWSDTWQLVINTGTTIVTFLMVFLIQNTQNRDSEAMQVKLDEVIRALKRADNAVLASEDLTEQQLQQLQQHYSYLAQDAQSRQPQQEHKAEKRQ